jgi:hypothetical protein
MQQYTFKVTHFSLKLAVVNVPKSIYTVENIHSAVKELSYATLRSMACKFKF